jgi:hypothetical protein
MFFGKTPVSTDEEIRPASAVNIIGSFSQEFIESLKNVEDGERIIIEKV